MKKILAIIMALSFVSANLSAQETTFNFSGSANFTGEFFGPEDEFNFNALGLVLNASTDYTLSISFDSTSVMNTTSGSFVTYSPSSVAFNIGNINANYSDTSNFDLLASMGDGDNPNFFTFTLFDGSLLDLGGGFFLSSLSVDAGNNAGGPGNADLSTYTTNDFASLDLLFGEIAFVGTTDNSDFGGAFTFETFQLESITSSVPEPATWLMMVFGFAGVGTALKRRRRMIANV